MAVSASPKLDKLLGRQVWLSYFNLSAGYSYFRNVFAGLSYVAVSTHSCISWSEMYVLVILLWTLSTTYTRVYELFHVFFTVGVSWHSIWWSSEFIAISGRSMSWSLHSSSLTCFFGEFHWSSSLGHFVHVTLTGWVSETVGETLCDLYFPLET